MCELACWNSRGSQATAQGHHYYQAYCRLSLWLLHMHAHACTHARTHTHAHTHTHTLTHDRTEPWTDTNMWSMDWLQYCKAWQPICHMKPVLLASSLHDRKKLCCFFLLIKLRLTRIKPQKVLLYSNRFQGKTRYKERALLALFHQCDTSHSFYHAVNQSDNTYVKTCNQFLWISKHYVRNNLQSDHTINSQKQLYKIRMLKYWLINLPNHHDVISRKH